MMRAATLFRAAALAAVAALALPVAESAHAAVYTHSNSEQQAIDDMVARLAAARTAQIGAIDAHHDYLVKALGRERQLLTDAGLALRDQQLATVMSAPMRSAKSQQLLDQAIGFDFREMFGGEPAIDPALLRSIDRDITRVSARLARSRGELQRYIVRFEAAGGEGVYCDDEGSGTPVATLAPGDASNKFLAIKSRCREIEQDIAARKAIYDGIAAPAARALLGDTRVTDEPGRVGEALAEQRQLAVLVAAQRQLSRAANAQVKALERYYKCQQQIPTLAGSISGDAEAVQKLIDDLAKGDPAVTFDKANFDALLAVLALPTRPGCGTPPAAPAAANSPAAAPGASLPTVDADKVLQAVKALDKYAGGSALLAGIQQAALAVQASAVSKALDGLASAGGPVPADRAGRIARAALDLAGNIAQLDQARRGTLPDTAGVLVTLADLRMKAASAAIEAERLQSLQPLAALRLAALRQRMVHLADARAALRVGGDGYESALLRYADSWNRGAIPDRIIENDMTKSRYLPWLAREKVVVEAMYAILEPAMAELQTYGKGGIKAETIAGYLQVLGIGAIAATK